MSGELDRIETLVKKEVCQISRLELASSAARSEGLAHVRRGHNFVRYRRQQNHMQSY